MLNHGCLSALVAVRTRQFVAAVANRCSANLQQCEPPVGCLNVLPKGLVAESPCEHVFDLGG